MIALKTSTGDFDRIEAMLRPWLGEVRVRNLPGNPEDIYVSMSLAGCGFRNLSWQKNHADPDWIAAKWRTHTGVNCPRCRSEIQALLKNHRLSERIVTGAPYIFCECVRLNPSRLPSISFFTGHWPIVLEALSFFEQVARELKIERDRMYRAQFGEKVASK